MEIVGTPRSLDRAEIMNVFRPNTVMDLPSGFGGRKKQLLELLDGLFSEGSCPIIYGPRGVGKSSLAIQVHLIAEGDTQLLEDWDEESYFFEGDQQFRTFRMTCSDSTRTFEDILQRIMTDAECLDIHEKPTTSEKTRKIKFFKFVEWQEKWFYQTSSGSIENRFQAWLTALKDRGTRRLLFVIDELDRVSNTKGLASFIKNSSDKDTRFLLVGAGSNVSSLLADHRSLSRIVIAVKVPPMSDVDMKQVLHKAQERLEDAEIDFTQSAASLLVRAAGGFPWFLHIIGQEALRVTWEADRLSVEGDDVRKAIKSLAVNRFATEFSHDYSKAVGHSKRRELMLRAAATFNAPEIDVRRLIEIAQLLKISKPRDIMRQLQDEKFGPVLVLASGQRVARFSNEMFKRYVNLRDPIFQEVEQDIIRLITSEGVSAEGYFSLFRAG